MQWPYIIFCYLSLFFLGFIDNSRGALYPEFLDFFQINSLQGALIFSLASLMGLIATIFTKWWLRVIGAINATRLGLLLHASSCVIMSFTPADSYPLFLFAALLFGTGVGIETVALNIIIGYTTTNEYRRRVFAGLHSMYGIASVISPFLAGQLIHYDISFQIFYFILSIPPFLVFLGTLKLKRLSIVKVETKEFILPRKLIVLLGLLMGCYVASEILVSSRLVFYIKELNLMSVENAKYLLTLFFTGLLFGRLAITLFHFSISSLNLLKLSMFLTLAISLIGILFYPPLLALTGLSMSVFFPTAMDYLGDIFGENFDIIMSKVFIAVGGLLFFIHWFFGFITEIFSIHFAIWILPVFVSIVLYILQFELKNLSNRA